MKYGYARASTDDRKADMQRTALKKAGCTKIFTDDGISGATVNALPFLSFQGPFLGERKQR